MRYSIPNVGAQCIVPVQLKVYDILGNEVATLVNEEKAVGYYEVEWDASRVASGVYIYRLAAGSFVSTKKMMILK
ncbi:MAG: T9SS type A sorting domain-containing protein [Ignavibacteriaceae bacterium]|nr:T9SS type A sorting domain-containing protein [Ignavibacteriaceae bacterium]